jgi:hypothetical protein
MAREQFTAGLADTDVRTGERDSAGRPDLSRRLMRRSTETKAAYKTTELIAFVVAVIGVLIATAMVDQADAGGLGARQGWTLVAALTIGYMVSRGLAKSGSREPYTEHDETR